MKAQTPKDIGSELYRYLNRPLMTTCTTSAAECRAPKSYSKLLYAKTVPSPIIKVTPSRVMIEEHSTRDNDSAVLDEVAPAANKTPAEENRTQTDETDAKREDTHAEYTPIGRGERCECPTRVHCGLHSASLRNRR